MAYKIYDYFFCWFIFTIFILCDPQANIFANIFANFISFSK